MKSRLSGNRELRRLCSIKALQNSKIQKEFFVSFLFV